MTLRFAVEGKSPDAPEDESYWHKVKRWIRPIVVEPSDASALLPTPPDHGRVQKPEDDIPTTSWIGSLFGSILPSSLGGKQANNPSPPPSTRMRSPPPKGYFSRGDAIAVLLLNDAGAFELQSLTVYYPSMCRSHNVYAFVSSDFSLSIEQLLQAHKTGSGRRTLGLQTKTPRNSPKQRVNRNRKQRVIDSGTDNIGFICVF